jgi:hypothetical protein
VRILRVVFASTLLVMGRIRQLVGAVMARVRAFRGRQIAAPPFEAEIGGASGSLAARVVREKREPMRAWNGWTDLGCLPAGRSSGEADPHSFLKYDSRLRAKWGATSAELARVLFQSI